MTRPVVVHIDELVVDGRASSDLAPAVAAELARQLAGVRAPADPDRLAEAIETALKEAGRERHIRRP